MTNLLGAAAIACKVLMLMAALPLETMALPPTDDPVLRQMRPKVEAVAMKDDQTVRGAITAAAEARTAQLASLTDAERVQPQNRTSIVIPKGVHDGKGLTEVRDVNLFGVTGNPADVEIRSDVKGAGGTIHALGALYVEGITLRTEPGADGTGPKYPLHVTWVERFCRFIHTTVFANCRFVANTSYSGPPGNVMGMDGAEGSYTLFYKCEFKGNGTNMHGATGNKKPLTLLYVKCSGTSIGYSDLGAGTADNIYVIDCEFPSVDIDGKNTTLYLSEGSKIGKVNATKVVKASDWPMPTGGLSPDDQAAVPAK